MTKESTQTLRDQIKFKGKIQTVAGVLAIGVLGSGLYDFLAKPGLHKVGGWLLNLVSFGSESIKNYIYLNAALDPTNLSGLILLMLLTMVPIFMIPKIVVESFFGPKIEDKIEAEINKLEEENTDSPEIVINYIKNKIHFHSYIMIFLLIILFLMSFSAFLVINQSVVIYKIFNANISICSPYMNSQEEKVFRSRFSSMKSKSDYVKLNQDLSKIAMANNVHLIDAESL